MQDSGWEGAWSGIFFHKNGLGSFAALGAFVMGFAASLATRWTRRIFLAGAVACLFVIVMSKSTTALLTLVSMSIFAVTMRLMQKSLTIWTLALAVGAVVFTTLGAAVMITMGYEGVLAVFGKDASLTGRLPIWQFVWAHINNGHFWLGYGYQAFWGEYAMPVRAYELRYGYTPAHSHNGLLELWLDLGFLGVAFFAVVFSVMVSKAVAFARAEKTIASLWPVVFLVGAFIIGNISEAKILQRNDLIWSQGVAIALFLNLYFQFNPFKQRLKL